MALTDEATRVVAAAGQLQGPTANLANTRALVVEPMLAALGWDVTNLEHVARDWPLDDGASISYALRLRDGSALFVETAPVHTSVDDQALVDETLEHVASADTRWCLLTNGLRYRLFKADDAVAKDDRLMFDVDLAEVAASSSSEAADNLLLLTRESLMDGVLEARGEEFYIDPRIQRALLELCRTPSNTFINAMNEAVGDPPVPVRRLRASLGRAVDGGNRSRSTTEVPTLGRPRTSHAPAHAAAAADEGEGSSEPHPAGTESFTAAPESLAEGGVGLATVDSPYVEDSTEVAELDDGQAPAAGVELAEAELSEDADSASLAGPQPIGDPELVEEEEEEATEQLEEAAQAEAEQLEEAEEAEATEATEATELLEEAEEAEQLEEAEEDEQLEEAEEDEEDEEDEASEATEQLEGAEATEPVAEAEATEEAEEAVEELEVHWKVAPPGRFGRQPEYPLADHFADKPEELVELFEGLDRFAHALGGDTARRVRRQNIEYFNGGELWFAITFMGDAVRVTLAPSTSALEAWHAADPERSHIASSPVDMLGEIEVTLADVSRLTDGCELIYAAYARA